MNREQEEATYRLLIQAVAELFNEKALEPASILFSTVYALYSELTKTDPLSRSELFRIIEEQGKSDAPVDVIRFCREGLRVSGFKTEQEGSDKDLTGSDGD